MSKPVTNVGESLRARLLNTARARNETFDLVLTRFALERFLYRLSNSEHRSSLILKGAMLFELWSGTPHRATRDLDLLAKSIDSDQIARILREICPPEVDPPDGLHFDLANLKIAEIREADRYGGIRAKFVARLTTAIIPIQIDFGIGDIVTPEPEETDYPTLLDMPAPRLLAYPRATVIAEKLEAVVDLGFANSRLKDFFDLWFFATTFNDDLESLAIAVRRTFERRGQTVPDSVPNGLSDEFAEYAGKHQQWAAFVGGLGTEAPSLADVIAEIRPWASKIFALARNTSA
ncbi:MAG: nucleotidyl transferase AbiEii/AbiGii toxin family protein [Armatimonadetes bacterium]|nr:nucleotidyl transferase AbiEii/AbiGii toxin family protein [Armatimonadota bacterium]